MGWKTPIKSVGLCFFGAGTQTELTALASKAGGAASFAHFLESADAATIETENFSNRGLSLLRVRAFAPWRPLFVGVDCAGAAPRARGRRCEKICRLRREGGESRA